jgi:GNAT superfamily N-acetyltransferase
MEERDLAEAARIFRLAFATYVGAPDPENFYTDRSHVFTRWRGDPEAALVAEFDGRLIGSNFLARWGSFGFFGPLTVHPDFWGVKVAQQLLARSLELFESWGVRDTALYTFSNSPKHLALYQKFGYWPRFLTAIVCKAIESKTVQPNAPRLQLFSKIAPEMRLRILKQCRDLTATIYPGLDVTREISSIADQALGDTLLLATMDSIDAFAACHCGENTEAGRGRCYVKFAAVRPQREQAHIFRKLLRACEQLAIERQLQHLELGVNTARIHAYQIVLEAGFRTETVGITMHRPTGAAYSLPDVYVLDDWR